MRNPKQVNCMLLLLCTTCVTVAQDVVEQNNTKTIGLQDPNIDGTVKSALENGSVSEVVVRKDLLLFPVNAPDLVIAHTQEIHAVPQTNGSDTYDGKPTAAEVAEVNEYSLSQLVSSNETGKNNSTENDAVPIARAFSHASENNAVLEPGKLLEIVSGFNLSDGLSTAKVSLPSEVQNISLPKETIVDLLSKSLSNATVTTEIPAYDEVKRSIDSNEDGSTDSSSSESSSEELNDDENSNNNETSKRSADSSETIETDNSNATSENGTKVTKRSTDSVEQDDDDDDDDSKSSTVKPTSETSTSTEMEERSVDSSDSESSSSTSSTVSNTDSSSDMTIKKRSIDSEEDDGDIDSSTQFVYYDHLVLNSPESSTVNISSTSIATKNNLPNQKKNLVQDSDEEMDVAEDIVFRPLFRYRQETRLRQQYNSRGRSDPSRRSYNSYDSDYD